MSHGNVDRCGDGVLCWPVGAVGKLMEVKSGGYTESGKEQ